MSIPPDQDMDVARARVMRAARKVDERGDMHTHAALMLAADTLDDALERDKAWGTKQDYIRNQDPPKLKVVPTRWERR